MGALWKDVSPQEIRYLFINEGKSQSEIAELFGVSKPTANRLIKNITTEEERKENRSRTATRMNQERSRDKERIAGGAKDDLYDLPELPVQNVVSIDEPKPKRQVRRAAKVELPSVTMPVLKEVHAIEYQGKSCVFKVDFSSGHIEMSDRNDGTMNGILDRGGLHFFIRELQQIEDLLKASKETAAAVM